MITYYFHVSKESRIKYSLEDNLFALQGNLIVSDFSAARLISEKINTVRRDEGRFNLQVTAGQINALGLLHEILHLLIRKYEENNNANIFKNSIDYLKNNLSETELNKTLLMFVEDFPPLQVYRNKISSADYLKGKTENKDNREIILEELILLNLENINPAIYQLKELYDDAKLANETKYKEIIEQTEMFFESEPKIGGFNLISFLRKPIIQSPYNIEEQLDFIRSNWIDFIDDSVLAKILSGKDLIHEDYKLFVQHGGGEKGTPPVPSYEFDYKYFESLKLKLAEGRKLSPEEYEYYQFETKRFTEDLDWMPRVVMIAKNAYVWLFQLSQKYSREIKTLDQIPDEELDRLALWNFTALWLIGIWERSSASRKIKQIMGNPEAASSAYSLYNYEIADELGGEQAFEILKARAWQRGIRLSSDMVPNHTGIYSKWVVDKPDYFIQSKTPPYPNYKFSGVNLSDDERVEVRIEDQYFSRTDAAVVFERYDKYTGDRTYIYHGNDGTNMPWNDTAQLNLMKPEVRESLIQTIMHVAQKTPIIRFDAAMTLAKKHYQRLWFPIPGTGGAIPSRSDYAMTHSQFDEFMPEEFWREVVDRINAEMPNTLLLAEAFWLMESYFVRTLGMHRVYNSAFMHMFMKEENEKYKLLIKNTLAFNPEILKRYVNFMSNPDEETAINQFGKGDKYFGVATMLVTLPGLPMFAHGQLEGFSEKYGMEYKRSYYTEFIDEHLVWLHEKEIFPLTKKRYLFSQVTDFEMFDFIDPAGNCNENVFAFTNKNGNETALVIYNNSYTEAAGKIYYSCDKSYGEEGKTKTTTIDKELNLSSYYGHYYIFKNYVNQLEYIVSGTEITSDGFAFHLMGYQRKVLLEFREVYDVDGRYKKLYEQLNGRGVDSIQRAIGEMNLAPFHNSLTHFSTSIKFSKLLLALDYNSNNEVEIPKFDDELLKIINTLEQVSQKTIVKDILLNSIQSDVLNINQFNNLAKEILSSARPPKWLSELISVLYDNNDAGRKRNLSFLLLNKILFKILQSISDEKINYKVFDELLLWKPLLEIYGFLRLDDPGKYYELSQLLYKADYNLNDPDTLSNNFVKDDLPVKFILINEYQDIKYFNKERIELLLKLVLYNSVFDSGTDYKPITKKSLTESLKKLFTGYKDLSDRINKSEYKIENILAAPIVSKKKSRKKKAETKTNVKAKSKNKNKTKSNTSKKKISAAKIKKSKSAIKKVSKTGEKKTKSKKT